MAIEAGNVVWNIVGNVKPLNDALGDSEKMVKSSMGNILKIGQQVGVAFAGVGAAVSGAFGVAINSAMDFGGEIKDASDKTLIAAEDLQKLKYAAEQSGVGFEGLQSAIIRMNKNLGEAAATGKGPFVDALASVGMKLQDLQGLTPDQQFLKLADAINGVTDPAQRTLLAVDLLGKSGANLLPMFTEGAAGITQLGMRAQELGLILKEDGVNAAEAFGDQWETLKGQFQAMAVQVGAALIPTLSKIMPIVQEIVASVVNWIAANPEIVTTLGLVAGAVGSAMLALSPLLIMLPGIVTAFAGIGPVVTAVGAVLAGISIPAAIAAGAIGVGLVLAWDYLKAAFNAAVGWVQSNWDQIVGVWDAAVGVVGAVMDVFAEALRAGFTLIGAAMDGFGMAMVDGWNIVADGAKQGGGSFMDTLKKLLEVARTVIGGVAEKIGMLANWIKTNWDDIAAATRAFANNIINPIAQIAEVVLPIIARIVVAIGELVDAFNSLPDYLKTAFASGANPASALTDLMSAIDGKALGGSVSAGVPYIVGEQGQELFVPDSDGRIVPAHQTAQMMSGGNSGATININGYNRDPRSLAEEISRIMYSDQLAFGRA